MNIKTYFKKTSDTQERLAKRLNITQGAISQWISTRVPAERVIRVEEETNGLVSRYEMRPDIFGIIKEVA